MRRDLLLICILLLMGDSVIAESEVMLRHLRVETKGLKPPLNDNHFLLEIANYREHATWFVWPRRGNLSLPRNGVFRAPNKWNTEYLTISKVDGAELKGEGQLTVLRFIGERVGEVDHSFQAILVPAKGTVKINDFHVSSWGTLETYEILIVSEILVDGKLAMEDWLPYHVSSSNVVILKEKPLMFSAKLPKSKSGEKPQGEWQNQLDSLVMDVIEIKEWKIIDGRAISLSTR